MPNPDTLDATHPAENAVTSREPNEIRWTLLDEPELEDAYWKSVAQDLQNEGRDPEQEKPTHEWLRSNGYRTLLYALREHHETTFSAFWNGLSRTQPPGEDSRSWPSSHQKTQDGLDSYLESRRDRGGLAESSIDALHSRLARYVEAVIEETGDEDLITPVARDSNTPAHEAVDAAWGAFDRLDADLADTTVRRIHEAAESWYAHLIRRRWASTNPVSGLEQEYNWTASATSEPTHLDSEHIRALATAAENPREDVLVRALCAWGLRTEEVARLHASNLVLRPDDDDVPLLKFDERKNGPGEVSLLYGMQELEARLDELGDDDWNGYVFPSTHSDNAHVSTETIRRWFDDLAGRANLPRPDGKKPVPKMARRYWYDAYTQSLNAVADGIDEIAAEQGSSDPHVVMQNYLDDERNRKLRREFMRNRLQEAFGSY